MANQTQKELRAASRKQKPVTEQGGFYAGGYAQGELEDLQLNPMAGLQEEIRMLRVVMRRLFETANNENMDMAAWGEVLSVLGLSASRLATLLRAEKTLSAESNLVAAALNQALSEVLKEMEA